MYSYCTDQLSRHMYMNMSQLQQDTCLYLCVQYRHYMIYIYHTGTLTRYGFIQFIWYTYTHVVRSTAAAAAVPVK